MDKKKMFKKPSFPKIDFGNLVSGIKSMKPTRPMKFPYTYTAKIAQFPYKFYFQNSWMYRYYPFGVLLSLPVFMYISSLANSPENKAKWAEIRRKEREEVHYRH